MIIKTTQRGLAAETAVIDFLEAHGYKLLGRNWRTRVCEIDIVARKGGTVYFVEVKFRSSDSQGDGFEYITRSKSRKMSFAAEIWCQSHGYYGDYRLAAASVSGNDFEYIELIELD